MARLTITTTPQKICEGTVLAFGGDKQDEHMARSFAICKPAGGAGGTVLLERGTNGEVAPSMDAAARFDFATQSLSYECEPGVALWASTSSGTVDLDVLRGGER